MRTENFFECLEIEHDLGRLSPEDNLDKFPITHGEGCWSWGSAHYKCACRELAKAAEPVLVRCPRCWEPMFAPKAQVEPVADRAKGR